ncbi:D-amino-acid transaminase [Litoreibacter arenae]|uniref:Probable branched-chain-amino-acid aminotransferase n=1 Tax=Litoreibacter arenae DSM 19593 TaxID=1123360 RepID=S9Q794_9RHOB|nr:D-amino-acid transaminase [Litoreibacter arenae]EPX77246.1 D-alanine aminotransferase [Litoreibacter arenae DSM 19593]
MSRIVYVNGDYLPEEEAKVSVFDRGFLFADAVYEVTSILDGKIIAFDGHAKRLKRSLDELQMQNPISTEDLLEVHHQLVKRNELTEGMIYLQISRGNPGDRDFAFPSEDVTPTIVLFTQTANLLNNPKVATGMKVISVDDQRWARRDIKTTQLLFPSMAKMMAKAAGVDDAWMVEDGHVTEGSSNNAYIVKDGKIITRNLGHEILHGITRAAVLAYAEAAQMQIEERPFTIDEAKKADEAFITSASTFVMPVVEIDGVALGDGKPGKSSLRLREIYLEESLKQAV